jgi:plasmid maintenance system killer protein
MGKLLPTILDTKYENIISKERSLAKTVANAVIGQNQVAVWDVLIPIVFLFNFLRFKRAREIFALNFMFTKKLALQGALDMIRRGQSKEDALAQIKKKTSDILASDKEGVYSIKIRQKQMKEIELLVEHYHKLLNAEGKDYATMVKNTYKDREDYAAFIAQLEQVEEEVIRAATQTVKTSSASGIVSKIEETTDRVRAAEIERIFGGRSS